MKNRTNRRMPVGSSLAYFTSSRIKNTRHMLVRLCFCLAIRKSPQRLRRRSLRNALILTRHKKHPSFCGSSHRCIAMPSARWTASKSYRKEVPPLHKQRRLRSRRTDSYRKELRPLRWQRRLRSRRTDPMKAPGIFTSFHCALVVENVPSNRMRELPTPASF